ncbi:cupin domain-containing protein [Streptomyces europaeiscabiei]|uniref:cupin domain-containing protein n=1 Tax=Streptomyces europaeiscabiei TaxID=146819 RepID=UPI0029B6852D|nr:cupin domain-containing protein [Streptomyces europaeiscabiei]MDX3694899.1 cupin domain-containing protein [Streptomyces europaeiscabiei]
MLAGFEVNRADEAPRRQVTEGIVMRMLQEGAEGSLSAMLIDFDPGAKFGEEIHQEQEILFVLEGEFHDGEHVHPAGTLITAQKGSVHWPQSQTGCRVLVLYPNGAGQ